MPLPKLRYSLKLSPLLSIAATVLIVGVAGLFFIGLSLSAQVGRRPSVGTLAPDLTLKLYPNTDVDKRASFTLSDSRGKIVVLNFWASWCVPCRDEASALENIRRAYSPEQMALIGIGYLDTEADALRFISEFGLSYPNGPDIEQRIARLYRITGVPETFVIDHTGIVRNVFLAPINEAQLRDAINPLLP